ncbi:MAG TPA: GGDEF domain-containing protein [Candidatus Saccharimonadales bacterium]|nr:GGDEF domain-containing protein [Candidatus Saccharimonadales bacterium]
MDVQAESTRERADYANRIRRQNERLAYGVAAFLMLTAALPVTREDDRVGVLFAGALVLVIGVVWFRVVPAHAFGDRRVMVFGVLAQPVIVLLLALTGGLRSEYFPFALLLVITTVFSPQVRHTFVVAAATALSLVLVAVLVPAGSAAEIVAGLGVWLLETIGFAVLAAMIGRTLRASRSAIAARADELDDLRGRAELLSFTDPLTGLYNRRFADESLKRLIPEARRGRTFSIAAFDLDGFKQLNDSRGHAAGDEILVDFARLLRAGLRGADIPIRMGGDEFLILLPGTGLAQTILVVERLRAAVREARWGHPDAIVTVSTGIAQWTDGQSGEALLQSADRSLYIAKRTLQAAAEAAPR